MSPGYGSVKYNGLPTVFIATVTAALEVGALAYARGVIDNHFRYYVRDDGMGWHSAEELPASARSLTALALYHRYSGDTGDFVLQYFDKARALADLLLARRAASLRYGEDDPRHGIPAGLDDALHADVPPLSAPIAGTALPVHRYASAAELYRACKEMGAVWAAVGKSKGRGDVAAHGEALLTLAPTVRQQLQSSLNRTARSVGSATCWGTSAEGTPPPSFRGHAEMMHSGALTARQVADIYHAASGSSCGNRTLVLGSPAVGGADISTRSQISTPSCYGLGHGLLQADLVEPFLLHFFALSAHSYTRGTWTTPESSDVLDRDVPTVAFAAAGQVAVPTYLKWMLCFEEPEGRTLWLAKATPRDWLAAGEAPLVASRLTTRYGRVSYSLVATEVGGYYTVVANVSVPASFASSPPAGGLRLRLRAPSAFAGRLSGVSVGGSAWSAFSAAEETVDFSAASLSAELVAHGLPRIVATFA